MVSSDLVGVGWVGWHLSKNGSGIAFVGPVRSHLLVRLTQGRAGHCLLRICQETHHIVAAGLSFTFSAASFRRERSLVARELRTG